MHQPSHHNHSQQIEHVDHDKHKGHSSTLFKRKFWAAFALTIPTVLLSPAVQQWLNIDWSFTGSGYIPAILGTAIFFYGGVIFLKGAWSELAIKRPGMMTLISMAISVAFAYSMAVTFRLVDGMDFWWELATLVTIMLLGHWLEMASVQNAQGALGELAKLLPDEAEVVHGDDIMKMSVNELAIGNLVLVRPGSQIPVDGKIIKGTSDIDESMLTGESKPVTKSVNATVIGGTINGSGALIIKVVKIGSETALAGIMRLITEAQASKSSTQILADKAAGYLTYLALSAALITWLAWWIAGAEPTYILERVVTVLIIACPHALGLAVPLVTAISATLAARNGLLVRQRMGLESARNIDVVLFDKTGTLTKGKQGVTDIVAADTARVLRVAAALEYESEHPIARAIVEYASRQGVQISAVENFSAISGRGVRGKINDTYAYAGGPQIIEELETTIPTEIQSAADIASADGKTVVYIIEDAIVIGAIMLTDMIRDESREAVETLQSMGMRVAILTGDNEGVAKWVANELKITEYFANVLPEHKADAVKQLQQDGTRVAMVGDGVNDAPALTQADVGIAIGAGTDVAIESAGIVLVSSDPRGVAKTIKLSKITYRKMLQNLAWATGYNAIAIPLAAGITIGFGFVLSPAIGAALMSLSTIIVAINAQLLRKERLS